MGRVFNTINLHVYHYAGNNSVKYTDPDGRSVLEDIEDISARYLNEAKELIKASLINWAKNYPATTIRGSTKFSEVDFKER